MVSIQRRRGLSLVEGLIALVILSVGFVALLSSSSQETRFTGLTRERFLAELSLRQLREAYRGWTQLEYSSFPATEEEFFSVDLYPTLLTDNPLLQDSADPERAEVDRAFREASEKAGIERAVLYREVEAEGQRVGIVTFLVRYPRKEGHATLRYVHIAY